MEGSLENEKNRVLFNNVQSIISKSNNHYSLITQSIVFSELNLE